MESQWICCNSGLCTISGIDIDANKFVNDTNIGRLRFFDNSEKSFSPNAKILRKHLSVEMANAKEFDGDRSFLHEISCIRLDRFFWESRKMEFSIATKAKNPFLVNFDSNDNGKIFFGTKWPRIRSKNRHSSILWTHERKWTSPKSWNKDATWQISIHSLNSTKTTTTVATEISYWILTPSTIEEKDLSDENNDEPTYLLPLFWPAIGIRALESTWESTTTDISIEELTCQAMESNCPNNMNM